MKRAAPLLLLLALSGCRTLDRFDTADGDAFCGSIVSAQFVRQGYPPDLRLSLTLDTNSLSSTPGSITTDDAETGPCVPLPRFDHAVLRTSEELQSDQLATLEFGTGRDFNFIAWTESTCEGPTLAVVSLMKNDDVEVRLLRPPPPASPPDPPKAAGFALFQLKRRSGGCGF
jgi:hypothetical protein